MSRSAKILLIRFSSLGDVVLVTAAVEAVAEQFPDVEIHVLTKPSFKDVFSGNPAVSRVLAWDPAGGILKLSQQVRAERYNWIFDLHGNLRTRLLRVLSSSARWSVYRKGAIRRRLAVILRRPGLLSRTHVVDRYMAALRPFGVTAHRRLPRMYPGARELERVTELLFEEGWDGSSLLLALAPGARWATKAWPKERWRELLGAVQAAGTTLPVLLGGEDESLLCRELLRENGGRGANLAGRTSVIETAAALKLCSALATNDSALLHMAAAVGTPVVALFGPTVRGFGFFPLGEEDEVVERMLECRPCSLHGGERCVKGHHRCLADIDALTVFDRIQRLLARNKK